MRPPELHRYKKKTTNAEIAAAARSPTFAGSRRRGDLAVNGAAASSHFSFLFYSQRCGRRPCSRDHRVGPPQPRRAHRAPRRWPHTRPHSPEWPEQQQQRPARERMRGWGRGHLAPLRAATGHSSELFSLNNAETQSKGYLHSSIIDHKIKTETKFDLLYILLLTYVLYCTYIHK